MKRRFLPLAFLPLSLAAGCCSIVEHYQLGAENQVIAVRESPGGRKETFRLEMGGDAYLRAAREDERERPALGLELAELDKKQAERRGVKPYSGLLVTGVTAKSGAKEAGVLVGDVLLSLDARETVYLEQVATFEERLHADQNVAAKVLRGQDAIDLGITVKTLRERVYEEESVVLDVPAAQRPYCGVTLRGIPAAWCQRVFGEPRQAVVVTGIEVGSPAWLAGIRPGDVIDRVDGAPVPEVNELARLIVEHGIEGRSMEFTVHRGSGPEHTGVAHLDDYSGDTSIRIPLLFDLRDGTYEDCWSVACGLLAYDRSRYVADASTRDVRTRNVFSALLGLVRVATSPHETEVRLLWLIDFDL